MAAIDKEFDYLVPDIWAQHVRVGTLVRVDLHGRRVGGWVVADGVEPPQGVALRHVAKVTGWGPSPDIIDLAGWAAWRWAGRRASLMRTASAEVAVRGLPPSTAGGEVAGVVAGGEVADLAFEVLAGAAGGSGSGGGRPEDLGLGRGGGSASGGGRGAGVLRLPPAIDPTPAILAAATLGPALVVVPSASRAANLAARLGAVGLQVALVPGNWAQARAGAQVVVGTRGAAWAPCPGMAAVVVVDGHDEGLVQEPAPTWDAVAVAAERARRAGAPCVVVSACPTLDLLAHRPLFRPSRDLERRGWAPLEVIDRRGDDPRLGLWSERLVETVRHGGRVACVLNRRGRGRLLACRACGGLGRCEACGAAVAEVADEVVAGVSRAGRAGGAVGGGGEGAGGGGERPGRGARGLVCPRCGVERPRVCAACGSTALRLLRIGVSRAREELEALAGRPVEEVSGRPGRHLDVGRADVGRADVVIGTEAVLHRGGLLDAVVFVDFDQELLAPRFRAGEEALAMMASASRLVGGRRRDGRVLVQTRLPDHPAIAAALHADAALFTDAEADIRARLRLPPYAALAAVSGPAAGEFVSRLAPPAAGGVGDAGALDGGASGGVGAGIEVLGPDRDRWLVKAPDAAALADALAGVDRPAGRLRVEVDPRRV
ncbi:MAG TPA: hypothetical protein VG184_12050 [Acidimicrobiales bacterium]|nr:hypothetical protein [Acidimicrobiales bacterium]